MDYVLYALYAALFAALYAAAWSLTGDRGRYALTLGLYAFHRRYTPPSRRWRHARAESRRGHLRAADHFPSWHQYFAEREDVPPTSALATVDTVVLPTFAEYWSPDGLASVASPAPHLVRAEQSVEEYGAEHWGGLLADMNTEERTVYSMELVEAYEATKAIERPFLDGLDAAIARFTVAMERLDRRTAAAFVGVGANLAKKHGGADRWSTGQFPLYVADGDARALEPA